MGNTVQKADEYKHRVQHWDLYCYMPAFLFPVDSDIYKQPFTQLPKENYP